jgi:hypothetical protein
MTFSPSWYTQHPDEEKAPVSVKGMSLEQFDGVVRKATTSNQDRTAAAITKADGFAWQVSNPWFKRTDTNLKLINNWLANKGITFPIYADFTEAAEELVNTGLLSVDEVERVKHLDGNGPKTFKGAITRRSFDSLDAMIAQERQAAIEQQGAEKQTDLERAFDALPIDDAKALIRDAERSHQAIADGKISQQNGDSWLTLHPEFRDDTANAKLMREQLLLNGVVNRPVTIEDYEVANRQLVSAGLVRQNPAALRKIQAQEVLDRANHAVKTSAAFDTTSEAAMYEMPLDEVRRRANGNFSGRD